MSVLRDVCDGVCLTDGQNFERHPLPGNIYRNGH